MQKFFYTLCFSILFFSASAITPQNLLPDTTSVCSGQSVTLSVSGALISGNSFVWSTSETTLSIVVSTLASAQYSITVTDGIDSYVDQTWIKVLPAPIVNVSADATSLSECSINNIYKNRVYSVVRTTLNVQYGQNNLYNGSNQNLLLDIYEPEAQVNYLRPLIIFAHGGGFTSGSKSAVNQTSFADSMARRGYIVACIDYRLGMPAPQNKPEHEVAIYRAAQDMNCAIRFFRKNAFQYKVDTSQIFIGGTSAGAVTAIYTAYWNKTEFPSSIDTTVLGNLWNAGGNAGYTTKPKGVLCFWGGVIDTNILFNNTFPPINEFQTTNDPTIPYTSGLYQSKFTIYGCYTINRAATAQGIESHLAPYNISGHGVSPGTVYWDSCMRHMLRFAYSHLTTPVNKKSIFSLTASGNSTQYSWAPSAGLSATTGLNVFATPTATTTYTVTAVGANGCSSTATVVINIVPKYSLTVTPSSTSVCLGSSVSLSSSGAPIFQWSPATALTSTTGGSTISNPTSAITYTVTGFDLQGCTGKTSVVVNVNPLPSLSISGLQNSYCANSYSNALTLSPLGGTLSGQGISGNVFAPSSVSTFNQPVSVSYNYTDANGCSNSTSESTTVHSLPSVQLTSNSPSVCIGGSATITASGASNYNWNYTNASVTTQNAGSAVVVPQANSLITVVGTDAYSCSASANISVGVYSVPPVSLSADHTSVCDGGTATVTASGATTYNWSISNASVVTQNPDNATIVPQSNAIVQVTGTDASGCSSSNSISIGVHALPSVSISSNQTAVCEGNTATIIGSGANTYLWILTNATLVTQNTDNVIVIPQNNSSIQVTGTDANGCSSSNSISIGVNASPIVSLSSDKYSVCPGETVALTASGAALYSWSYTNATLVSQNGNQLVINSNANSDVTVIGTDALGCSSSSSVFISNSGAAPAKPTFGNTVAWVCKSQTGVVFSVTPIAGVTSYTWSAGTGATIVSGQGTATITVNFSASAVAGNISVFASNNCGNSQTNSFAYSIATAKPATPGAVTGAAIVCPLTTVSYSIAAVAKATSYIWTAPANTTILSGQGTTSISLSFSSSWTSGNLTVKASNCYGTSAAKTKTLYGKPSIPASITGSTSGVCAGTSGVIYIASTVASASSYTWTAPLNASIASGQGTATVTVNFNASFTSGILTVVANNTCGSSGVRSTTILSVPSVPMTINGPGFGLCSSSNQNFYVTNDAAATSYTWTVPANMSITSGQGTNSIIVSTSSSFVSGSVKVTANNACGSSAQKTLTVYAKPSLPGVISGSTIVCANDTGKIYTIAAVTGATTYTWTVPGGATIVSGQGTTSIKISYGTAGGSVTVKASNVCAVSNTRTLTVSMSCKSDLENDESTFVIYPNPSNGKFNVQFSRIESGVLTVTDLLGRIIYQSQISESVSEKINISNEATGLYLVEWKTADAVLLKKVVVER